MSRRVLVIATAMLSACAIQRSQPNAPARSRASSAISADDHMAHMSAADMAMPSMRMGASMAQQGLAGLPASNATSEARLKASPRHGEWVKIPWGGDAKDSLMAWIVYPASPNARAKAPVVVVVHEIYGLSTWVRGVADQAAADGFIAIAPDLVSRTRPGGPSNDELPRDTASKYIRAVPNSDRVLGVIAAANYAMMQPSAQQKYAVIGYCWGGQTVFMHAVNGGVKGFAGGVAYYGLPYMSGGSPATATAAAVPATFTIDSLKKIKAPVMLLNGSKDARIAAAMPALDSLMKALRKNYSGTNYDGATHGFLRAQNDPKAQNRDEVEEAANLAATKDAWPKTLAFLRKNLRVH